MLFRSPQYMKSASILTKVKGGKLVIDKVDGKYFMYWGEYAVHAATSDNLTDWYPVLDENNELLKIAKPRNGYFDSRMTECGPPAIRTKQGIVLMYNGKNDKKRGESSGSMLYKALHTVRLRSLLPAGLHNHPDIRCFQIHLHRGKVPDCPISSWSLHPHSRHNLYGKFFYLYLVLNYLRHGKAQQSFRLSRWQLD